MQQRHPRHDRPRQDQPRLERPERIDNTPREAKDHRHKPAEKAADFLPHPETLEAYNYVIEGSAERILAMIEQEQKHRQALEDRALSIQQAGFFFGQFLAAIVALSVIVLTGVLALNNHIEVAAFFGVVGLACMTIAFVKGRQLAASSGNRRHPQRSYRGQGDGRINPSAHRRHPRTPIENAPL